MGKQDVYSLLRLWRITVGMISTICKGGKIMQMCPFCDKVYDESEYSRCPYCSGELEDDTGERYFKNCPNCGGIMYWDDEWECTNCGETIDSDEDDNDGIIEG